MNEIELVRGDLPTILEAGHMVCKKPFLHPDRNLPFNVLLYVYCGKINVVEEDTQYDICEGELIFLKNKKHHWGTKLIESGTEWYYIHFYNSDNGKEALTLPKKIQGIRHSDLEENLIDFIGKVNNPKPSDIWKLQANLYLLCVDIAFFSVSVTDSKVQLSDKLQDYLKKNVAQPFDAKMLSQEFNLTEKYLEAIFKEQKHISLQKYHTYLKVQEACRLLRTSIYSIGEIAQKLGYQNAFYFSRVFSSQTGIAPSEYRKQIRKSGYLQ